MKHEGHDPKQALVEQELLSWFKNEVVDEELVGYRMTRVDLSSDRSHLTLWYLPPDDGPPDDGPPDDGPRVGEALEAGTGVGGIPEERGAAREGRIQELFASYRWEVLDLVEEILRKHPGIRWREDRGAENKRRVESILEDLRGASGEASGEERSE